MQSKELSKKNIGDAAEDRAAAHLQRAGLRLLQRNYRTPGRGGGEIDLVMRDVDGTLVFIEVRQRASGSHGGAAASVTARKQQRIIFAARHYLMRLHPLPPCRFDVVGIDYPAHGGPPVLEWLKAAFDAG
ncbi:MAG: YraN family protein [Pseudomonadota bacterium]